MTQRKRLRARQKDIRHTSAAERGHGAKGHGRSRRYETYDALGDKVSRVSTTFCQQTAAKVAERAKELGCGTVIIEDYGGIDPNEDRSLRRFLDRFPLYEMKQSITSRLEKDNIVLREVPAEFISTTCPRCKDQNTAFHNRRTGIFHCRTCTFERPADFIAAYWMLQHSGADMSVWEKRFHSERQLAESIRQGETR